jgi:hypothetical protein
MVPLKETHASPNTGCIKRRVHMGLSALQHQCAVSSHIEAEADINCKFHTPQCRKSLVFNAKADDERRCHAHVSQEKKHANVPSSANLQ